jgi:crotonobetainyl-CoA:carnitine CoA-transferase CaiB-like acyl-CoA transferase
MRPELKENYMSYPLRGVKVIDFSVGLAWPWCTGIMADQGATVIKVERPGIGATGRFGGAQSNGIGSMFEVSNRGKQSIVIDLSTKEGAGIALDLCASADVVVQNYRPGVAERIGVGYEQIRERNPKVVYLAIAGFGTKGPDADLRVYDTAVQARSGMSALQGGYPPRCAAADPAGDQ